MVSRIRSPRASPRQRRRLKVAFLNDASFTTDVGDGGFATQRIRIFPAGLRVEGSISSPEREVRFTGRVAWSLPGDPLLNLRGRMGVQFIRVDPALREVLSRPGGPPLLGAALGPRPLVMPGPGAPPPPSRR